MMSTPSGSCAGRAFPVRSRIFLATSSARPISGDMAPRSSGIPARERSPSQGQMQLVMLGGRAEIPEDRLVVLRQQREAAVLVLRPGADVRGGDVAHVVHVEAEQRAHLGLRPAAP